MTKFYLNPFLDLKMLKLKTIMKEKLRRKINIKEIIETTVFRPRMHRLNL